MGDEAVPETQGEVGVAANEAGDEVILVSLDYAFYSVGAMKVWGNKLETYAGIAQKSFEASGALTVEHLVLGGEAAVREVGVEDSSGSDEFAFAARGGGGSTYGAAGWDGAIVREKLHSFGDAFCAGTWNVYTVTLVVVRRGSEVPSIDTVGGSGAAVAICLMDNDLGAGRC